MIVVIENTHGRAIRRGPNAGVVMPYLTARDDEDQILPIAMSKETAERDFGPLFHVGLMGTPMPAPPGLRVLVGPDDRERKTVPEENGPTEEELAA